MPRVPSETPELGWRVNPRTCISYTIGPRRWRLQDDDRLPSRRRTDRPPRSSSPSQCRPLRAAPPRGRSPSARRRPRPYGSSRTLCRIEPMTVRGVEGPGRPESVDLSRPETGHEHVPVVIVPVRRRIDRDDPRRPGIVVTIEQQQLDTRRVLREDAEVHAARYDAVAPSGAGIPAVTGSAAGRLSAGGGSDVSVLFMFFFRCRSPTAGGPALPSSSQASRRSCRTAG